MVNQITHSSLLRSLRSPAFALLWGGQTLSRLGDFLYQIALAWWVLQHTGSARAMATVLIFAFAPTLLFTLIGGVTVDRYSRIRTMLVTDLVRGAAVSGLAALVFTESVQLWHIYAVSLLTGMADAFFQPAFAAAVPDLVTEDDWPSANSLISLSMQAGRIVGPALGAALLASGGTAQAFLLNGLTFIGSALLLLPLLQGDRAVGGAAESLPKSASFWEELQEGFVIVLQTPWLWMSIAVFAFSNIALAGPYTVSLPFLVSGELGADAHALGLLYGAFAGGYGLGSLWLGGKATIQRRGQLIFGSLFIAGLMLALFGLSMGLVALVIAAVINGAALEVGTLAWTHALQEFVPREKLGRVASIDALGSLALLPIGYGLAGWATELLGAPTVFAIGGGLTATIAAIALCLPPIRALD